jgi:hypothetical protein
MTIPQIEAIRIRLGKHTPINLGMPNIWGVASENDTTGKGSSSQEDIDSFFNDF